MMQILLIGVELPLLEGLAQSFAALGYRPVVAQTLHEGRDLARQQPTLVGVVSQQLAAESNADALGIPLAPGGALVLFREPSQASLPMSPTLQRAVLADLTLPLERNRLLALVQHVGERARARGRTGETRGEGAHSRE